MGKIISNGINYSGLINANGVFIDTDNVIASGSYQSTFSYTATEDCFIRIEAVMSANNSASISIDGEPVTIGWCASLNTICPLLPLRKGQTLSVTASASNEAFYAVYGIQSGSSGGGGGIDYSTTEQKTGQKWIDGKDIYQKTFYVASIGAYDSTKDGYSIADNVIVDDLIEANGFIKVSTGQNYGYSYVHVTSGFAMLSSYEFALHLNDKGEFILWTGNSSYGAGVVGQELFVTIKYTKSTT